MIFNQVGRQCFLIWWYIRYIPKDGSEISQRKGQRGDCTVFAARKKV